MNVKVHATAHVDTFARDRLPARELWPDLLPAGLSYPDKLNAADELLAHDGPCVRGDEETWSYEELRERSGRVARGQAVAGEGVDVGGGVHVDVHAGLLARSSSRCAASAARATISCWTSDAPS